ncbi:MAG: nucleoside-diphosphate sugar epimerase/dehydratase, partial [Gemmatimonadales bacterium]
MAANYLAFWLRFNCAVPQDEMALFVRLLPWLVVVRSLTFIPLRLYQSVWRYTSTHDLINIISAATLSTLLLYLSVGDFLGIQGYPRSVYIIDPIVLICLLGGARLGRRLIYDWDRGDAERRVLIYGAGDAGEMIVRDMIRNPFYKIQPVGFIDDDPAKLGRRIHNVPVLGARKDMA